MPNAGPAPVILSWPPSANIQCLYKRSIYLHRHR